MQVSDRSKSYVMVHSLVLWEVSNHFLAAPSSELVSHYAAERLVAKNFYLESAAKLKSARRSL